MKPYIINLAKKLIALSEHPQHKHSCVIAKGNKVISFGVNKIKTSPHSNHPHKRIHAELSAILNARKDISGCDIYVYRENKKGEISLSKPCPACLELIKAANLKRIYYSDTDGFKEERI